MSSAFIGTGASRFELRNEIRQGRFGPVYECIGSDSKMRIAKCYLRADNEADRSQAGAHYEFERQLLTQLAHPCIVSLIDAFEDERGWWIVLERLDGNLGGYLKTYPEDIRRRRALLAQDLLHAVDAVHRLDYVHNDIRPRNIFVQQSATKSAGRIVFKLGDFGESFKLARPGETRRVGLGGWSHAPEGYDPGHYKPYGKTVDIYKSALVLLSARLGKTINLTRDEVLAAIPRKLALKARGPDSEVLAKALELEPGERFQTANEFLQALQEANARSA